MYFPAHLRIWQCLREQLPSLGMGMSTWALRPMTVTSLISETTFGGNPGGVQRTKAIAIEITKSTATIKTLPTRRMRIRMRNEEEGSPDPRGVFRLILIPILILPAAAVLSLTGPSGIYRISWSLGRNSTMKKALLALVALVATTAVAEA